MTDPRILRLAESRYRNGYGATAADAWDTLDAVLRQHLIGEAAAWLRAAVEAGIAPLAERPTDKHDAILLDNYGQLWGEYQTSPSSRRRDPPPRLGARPVQLQAGARRAGRRVPPHRLERVTTHAGPAAALEPRRPATPKSHTTRSSMTTNPTPDDRLCPSEFPGDDSFVGQLCERERGHEGAHEHLAVIEGTRYTRRLVWTAEVPR